MLRILESSITPLYTIEETATSRGSPRRPVSEWGIPGMVSAIVLKLLAKNAEDRYQTAQGVEADLRRCLSE
jgi:hypothetical protein